MEGDQVAMKVYDLGLRPRLDSMLCFHALAHLGREGLMLVSPASPIACVGYFQDAREVIDLDFCLRNGLEVMRREVGGGATLLDSSQVFYQVILRKDNPLVPPSVDGVYRKFSQPAVDAYGDLGVEVSFRPINDLVTREGRKIAGEGGADIGPCMAFVGGILLDFDYELMPRILKVPDEKFRDKFYKSLVGNLTTLRRETGRLVPREEVTAALKRRFAEVLGPLTEAAPDDELRAKMRELEARFRSDEFLFRKIRRPAARETRVREGIRFVDGVHKAPGGLLSCYAEVVEGVIDDVSITGDFTMVPRAGLEELEGAIAGAPYEPRPVSEAIEGFYNRTDVDTPGVEPDHYLAALGLTR
jgi:lipoate-protein ligase A